MRLLIFLVLLGLPLAASAQGLSGSAHDLRGAGGSFPAAAGELCVVCHAPHNNANTAGDLLWNRSATTETFETYASATLDAGAGGQAPPPSGVSLQCLSCHDGTLAVDSYGSTTGSLTMGNINGAADVGTDLSDDHPISIDLVSDGDINTAPQGANGPLPLFNGNMECGTCHDVHGEDSVPGTQLLYLDNSVGSALCQECHNK